MTFLLEWDNFYPKWHKKIRYIGGETKDENKEAPGKEHRDICTDDSSGYRHDTRDAGKYKGSGIFGERFFMEWS